MSFFAEVPLAPPDVIFNLTASYQADTDGKKVNLGVGAYRDDAGKPWVLPVVQKAKQVLLSDPNLNHEYLTIRGLPSFTEAAAKLILGPNSPAIAENRTVSAQSISGTGAVYLGALFLSRFYNKSKTVLISNPTWANHKAIFEMVGLDVQQYSYYSRETNGLDFDGMIRSLEAAPEGAIVLLHACAHNPTGVDPTLEQWKKIAEVIKAKKQFTFFDCAYQGFASGNLDRDAAAVRYFVEQGFELFVAQSFAKNFGLYGERCGALHVVSQNSEINNSVRSQLEKLNRATISNPPAFGARIVSLVLNDPVLFQEWVDDFQIMANRIKEMRQKLFQYLTEELKTPGTWNHIVDQIGMFSFTGLTAAQVKVLKEKYHVYLTDNGRISMAGLNTGNVEYFARAVDDVVRNVHQKSQI
ncbi:aspartate aminotransferase [Basidiobolus meristosporus CBS 931.73]|uniref:aspartate transaminase n=1 Tax=Basidiobolus meristosporus CBS 931.73 TaxID=1314790 RepID=A0A1Y1WVH2_9FUNG|nr:aspartate aminotransferase [Basidiobolus meristosporus CBS 931.73]|eukprot:ORX77513.1 aspartate aminotransferase [Basidiobolus meristosporus CBS 931.73]